MKIAVAYDNGTIFQHFGKTEFFKVYDVEDNQVVSSEIIGSNGTGHGALAGLLASGYNAYDAARLGVWLHGKAGDIAASMHGLNGMNSQDIALALGKAFLSLEG